MGRAPNVFLFRKPCHAFLRSCHVLFHTLYSLFFLLSMEWSLRIVKKKPHRYQLATSPIGYITAGAWGRLQLRTETWWLFCCFTVGQLKLRSGPKTNTKRFSTCHTSQICMYYVYAMARLRKQARPCHHLFISVKCQPRDQVCQEEKKTSRPGTGQRI